MADTVLDRVLAGDHSPETLERLHAEADEANRRAGVLGGVEALQKGAKPELLGSAALDDNIKTMYHGPLVGKWSDPAELNQQLFLLGVSGVNNEPGEYPFESYVEREGQKLYDAFADANGLTHSSHPDANDVRRRAKILSKSFFRVLSSEWTGAERDRYVPAMLDKMLDEQIAREYEQLRGIPESVPPTPLQTESAYAHLVTGKAPQRKDLTQAVENKAAAAQILKSQSPEVKVWLARTMLARALAPRNPDESEAKFQYGRSWFLGERISDAATVASEIAYYASPTRFLGDDHHTPDDLVVLFRQVFGPGAEEHAVRAYDRTHLKWAQHRLGILENEEGIVDTGFSPDGVNILSFAAPGLLSDIARVSTFSQDPDVATAALNFDPKIRMEVARAEARGNKIAKDRVVQAWLEHTLPGGDPETADPLVAEHRVAEAGGALTEVEKSFAGDMRMFRLQAQRLGLWYLDIWRGMGPAVDELVAKIPGVKALAQSAVRGFGGNRSEAVALSETVDTLGQALALEMKMAMENQTVLPLGADENVIRMGNQGTFATPASGIAPPVEAMSPEAYRGYLEFKNDPMKVVLSHPNKDIELYHKHLADVWDGKARYDPVKTPLKLLWTWGNDLGRGVKGLFGTLIDSPAEGVGLLAGGAASLNVAGTAFQGWRGATARMAAAQRLEHQLQQIVVHHKETAVSFLDGAKRALKDALGRGAPEDVTSRLQGASAALQLVLDEMKSVGKTVSGGPYKLDDVGRSVAAAWGNMSNYLGDLGAVIGTRNVAPSLWESVRQNWYTIMGSKGRPDRALSDMIRKIGTAGQQNIDALNHLWSLRSNADFRSAVHAWLDQHPGQTIPQSVVRSMAGEPIVTLDNMILSGRRSADVREPLTIRILGRLFPKLQAGGAFNSLSALVNDTDTLVTAGLQAAVDDIVLSRAWKAGPWSRWDALIRVTRDKLAQQITALDVEDAGLKSLTTETARLRAQEVAEKRYLAGQQQKLMDELRTRLDTHDPRQSWRPPPDATNVIFRDVLTREDLAAVLDAVPGRFANMNGASLWKAKKKRVKDVQWEAEVEAADKAYDAAYVKVEDLKEQVRAGTDIPDWDWRDLMRERQEVQARIDREAAQGLTPDPVAASKLRHLDTALERRKKTLMDDPDTSTEVEAAVMERDDARQARQRLAPGRLVIEKLPDETSMRKIGKLLRHQGAPEIFTTLDRIEGKIASVDGARRLLLTENYFGLSHLPSWLRGHALNMAPRLMELIYAGELAKAGNVLDTLRRLHPDDVEILNAAGGGDLPSSVIARMVPEARRKWESLHGNPKSAAQRLDELFKDERHLRAEYHVALRESQSIPEHLYAALDNEGYDPTLSALYLRPQVVTNRKVQEAMARKVGKTPGGEIGFGPPLEGDGLKFRRDPERWRVRIEEPQGIINHYFETKEGAEAALRDRYGRRPIRNQERNADGSIIRGTTPYGHKITIAEPSKKLAEYNDNIHGRGMEARLAQYKRGLEDLARHHLIEAMSGIPGWVLTKQQENSLSLQSPRYKALLDTYQKVPEVPTAFGSLAGKYVHPVVLDTLRSVSHTHKRIASLVEGMSDAITRGKHSLAVRAAGYVAKAGRGIFDLSKKVMSATQIILGPATWATNVVTSIFSDYLAGSDVFSSAGVDSWDWLLSGRYKKDPLFHMARRDGLTDGFFQDEFGKWNESLIDMVGFKTGELKSLQNLKQRRTALAQEVRRRYALGGREADERTIIGLERERMAIDAALEDAERAWYKRLGYWTIDWFYGGVQDNLGRPMNRAMHFLKGKYNAIDEGFKLMQFRNLVRKGLAPAEAASRIRRFSQMYGEVGEWTRNIPSPMAASIMAFPAEALKIMKNAIMYEPAKTMAFFGAIPMLNVGTIAAAGIPIDRFAALMEARGARDGLSFAKTMGTSILVPDNQGNLRAQIDLGAWIPLNLFLQGRGAMAQFFNALYPPEERGAVGHVAGTVVNTASNFFLNNIPFNFLLQTLANRDPVTGRQILSNDSTTYDRLGSAFKTLSQATFPLARAMWNWQKASDEVPQLVEGSPIGRPYQRPYPAEVVSRTLTGVGLKGDFDPKDGTTPLADDLAIFFSTFYKISNQLDPKRKLGDYALESPAHIKKELLAKSLHNARSEEERAVAREEFAKAVREERTVRLGFMERLRGRTERQMAMEIQSLMEHGPEQSFRSLEIHAQAAVLVSLDRARVSETMLRNLYDVSRFTKSGDETNEIDPTLVREAIGYLESALTDEGRSRVIDKWLDELKSITLPIAEINREFEKIDEPYQREYERALRSARRKEYQE